MNIKFFLDHLRVTKNSSIHTLAAYERDLKQFLEVLDKRKKTFTNADESDIQAYLKELKKREQKTTSISRKISAIRQYYKFLLQENLIKEDPSLFIESPAASKKLPKAIGPETLDKILKVVEKGSHYPDEKTDAAELKTRALRLRDRAMVYFLYATGVRVSELIQLPMQHMDLEAGYARVMGKRKKERVVPFVPIVTKYLHEYLATARPLLLSTSASKDSEIFFIGLGGEGLTRQGFWKTLKKIAVTAGINQSLHPHMLRHTFATDLLKSGMDLRSLQMLLGHADMQTTQVYTHIAPDHLQNVIKKYHPRGGK
jgi:integrase/recombinase XerD